MRGRARPFGRPRHTAWCEVVRRRGALTPGKPGRFPPSRALTATRTVDKSVLYRLLGPDGRTPRLTQDSAQRMVVWKVNSPESVQRKVGSSPDLVADGMIAAMVTHGLPAPSVGRLEDHGRRHRPAHRQLVSVRPAPAGRPKAYASPRRRGGGAGSTARGSWTWWRQRAVGPGQRAVQRPVVTDRRQPWRTPSRYPRSTCRSRPG
ncbi:MULTISPECIES: DUF6192 family protein [Streptomyces]|uniref:DUF6192 family protein n=1 Tax=Streptomyces TaxID=1883 RepID=UPI0038B5D63B